MRQLKITHQITQRTEDSINRYFQEISKYELVTADEEADLAARIRGGDDKALERLVLANLRFVISVAKQYQNQGLSFPDLINEGNLGLIKAAGKFDESRGFKFISYAVWWIRQSIIQAISEQTRTVRLPLNKLASINKITKAIPYLEQELERMPTEDEIAIYLDLNKNEVEVANHVKRPLLSLDKPMAVDSDSELTLNDLLHSESIPAPDNQLVTDSLITNIQRAVQKLPKREATIITMFYGLGNTTAHSLRDIAKKYDMTTERIRQIRGNGLIGLKRILKGKLSEI